LNPHLALAFSFFSSGERGFQLDGIISVKAPTHRQKNLSYAQPIPPLCLFHGGMVEFTIDADGSAIHLDTTDADSVTNGSLYQLDQDKSPKPG